MRMRPEVGSTSRLMQRRSVDLPDPLGPMIETNSPFATSSVTPSRALVPPGKTLVRPSTLTSGSLRVLLLQQVGLGLFDDFADDVVVPVLRGHQRVDGVKRFQGRLDSGIAAHRDHRVLELFLLRRVEGMADHLRVARDGVASGEDLGLGPDAGAWWFWALVRSSVVASLAPR